MGQGSQGGTQGPLRQKNTLIEPVYQIGEMLLKPQPRQQARQHPPFFTSTTELSSSLGAGTRGSAPLAGRQATRRQQAQARRAPQSRKAGQGFVSLRHTTRDLQKSDQLKILHTASPYKLLIFLITTVTQKKALGMFSKNTGARNQSVNPPSQ
ncbi:hypothetical protein Bbelb_002130 [Branchiostoma belcheri]|nr:hypothetical protein Bbelb_002130 [Branchiostoma belcheri]